MRSKSEPEPTRTAQSVGFAPGKHPTLLWGPVAPAIDVRSGPNCQVRLRKTHSRDSASLSSVGRELQNLDRRIWESKSPTPTGVPPTTARSPIDVESGRRIFQTFPYPPREGKPDRTTVGFLRPLPSPSSLSRARGGRVAAGNFFGVGFREEASGQGSRTVRQGLSDGRVPPEPSDLGNRENRSFVRFRGASDFQNGRAPPEPSDSGASEGPAISRGLGDPPPPLSRRLQALGAAGGGRYGPGEAAGGRLPPPTSPFRDESRRTDLRTCPSVVSEVEPRRFRGGGSVSEARRAIARRGVTSRTRGRRPYT